jgi:D-3-phosphoglycerate dehydrogenase / 2-oxoglutarate reductase
MRIFIEDMCQAARDVLNGHQIVDRVDVASDMMFWNKQPTDVECLWVRLTPVAAEALTYFPGLKYIACPCTDVSHIDLAECNRRGIRVLSLRDTDVLPTITATAEHTIGLILALVRKIPQAVESTKRGEWDRSRFMGRELNGMRAAVMGFGRIGKMVQQRLSVFGVEALPYPGINQPLLSSFDVVTVHLNLNDFTSGMCNAEFFAAMKDGAYFINTSRGQVVDEAALLASLRSGHLAGAGLDVAVGEPDGINPELIRFANEEPSKLILTPHIGGYCVESLEKAECALAKRLLQEIENEQA